MASAAPPRRHDTRRPTGAQTRRAQRSGVELTIRYALRSKAPSSCLQLLKPKEFLLELSRRHASIVPQLTEAELRSSSAWCPPPQHDTTTSQPHRPARLRH